MNELDCLSLSAAEIATDVGDSVSSEQSEVIAQDHAFFFEHSPDPQCILNFDGTYIRVNSAWAQRYGGSEHVQPGMPFVDSMHPDDREGVSNIFQKTVQGDRQLDVVSRCRQVDNSSCWMQWSAWPSLKHQRIYVIARDITAQKQLEKTALEILDQERERMGRELHDGLCQSLAGIAALSSALSIRLAKTKEVPATREIIKLLNESIDEAHCMAVDLAPVYLKDVSLDEALELLARDTEDRFLINCLYSCNQPFFKVSNKIKLHLFRITQEAVSNAINHARTDHIAIGLDFTADIGCVTIQDGGVGFTASTAQNRGMGLQTMTYRADLIGASLEIQPGDQRGTLVACRFPIATSSERIGKS